MGNSVGIDISADQAAVPEGPWLFVVHKATEGHDYVDPQFKTRYPTLTAQNEALRGAYHYARPGDGFTGAQQADFFADTVLAAGFVPGQDLWQLDCEGTGNEGVAQATWQEFILQFMAQATSRLGPRGFIYGGYSFLFTTEAVNAPVGWTNTFNWWDADYGVNDGGVHPLSAPAQYMPVVHQFTSRLDGESLDGNVVYDEVRWDKLFPVAPPVNWSWLKQLVALVKLLAYGPLVLGDLGPDVETLNRLLARQGYSNVLGNVYGARTAACVKAFKIAHHLKNQDGNAVGRSCVLALIKAKP